MTQDLLAALCLVFVIEGIMPFLLPQKWQRTLYDISQMHPSRVRIMSLCSMVAGVVGLYLVR